MGSRPDKAPKVAGLSSVAKPSKETKTTETALWRDGKDGSWTFEEIGEPFDEHVRKHLPGYDMIEQLAVSAAMWNVTRNARVLDVGCSTGQTLALLNARSRHPFSATGVDIDQGMIDSARKRVSGATFICNDFIAEPLDETKPFDVIFALFSLQFIPVGQRPAALDKIERLLAPGGLFLLAEKVEAGSSKVADLYSGLYSDWKLSHGVSPDEVLAKWASLRGQLVSCQAAEYEKWADASRLEGEIIWSWGPFRAWAFWKPPAFVEDS
jgi:tRNA (cmo5U34)-methyltransferase